jgi:hypothetical protein
VDEETLKHLLRGLGPTNPEGHVAPTAFVGMKKRRIKIWKRIIIIQLVGDLLTTFGLFVCNAGEEVCEKSRQQ